MNELPTDILVVDDMEPNRLLLRTYLTARGFGVREASNGQEALDMVQQRRPDLILLDVMMPGLTGYDVCERLRGLPGGQLIPIIMQTALEGSEEKARAADAGADDFISKPIDGTELVTRVRSLLRIKRLTDALDGAEHTIVALARAVGARDPYTRGHSERVGLFASRLAEKAGLAAVDVAGIHLAGILHDIGKIGICDDILLKPGRLEDSEWEQIRRHPVIGAEICKPLRSVQGQLPTIRHHHERWDGDGYPDGLRRDEIPLSARITAVCDAWDAITSDRVYRPGLTPARAIEILVSGKDGQWDRDLIELFVAHQPDITALAGLEASFASDQLAHLGEPVR